MFLLYIKYLFISFIFKISFIYLIEREQEKESAQEEGESEGESDSLMSRKPDLGLDPGTLGT